MPCRGDVKIYVMSKKNGRPKKAIIQERNIGFYVTFAQYSIIQRKMEEAGVNISDYMRQAAMTSEVKAKWTPEEREMVKKLIGMSVELNGMAVVAQEQGVAAAVGIFREYGVVMDEIIKRLCYDR